MNENKIISGSNMRWKRQQGLCQSLIVSLLLLLSACADSDYRVYTEFSTTQEVTQGSPLYFNEQIIGEVTNVENVGRGSRVEMVIENEYVEGLSQHSAVVVNSLKQGAPLELYNRNSSLAEPLQDGQKITGLDSVLHLGAWMLGGAIQVGNETLSDYVGTFQDYLQSENFSRDKQRLRDQIDIAANVTKEGLKQIEEDLITAAEQLRVTRDEAAVAIQALSDEMVPVVEELAAESDKLTAEIQKFADSMQNKSTEEREADAEFLASLLASIKQLNEALIGNTSDEQADQNQTADSESAELTEVEPEN